MIKSPQNDMAFSFLLLKTFFEICYARLFKKRFLFMIISTQESCKKALQRELNPGISQ